MQIDLPALPPPLSACFNNAKGPGRLKSKRYRAWIEHCSWALNNIRDHLVAGPVNVTYLIQRPDKRKRDLGNLEKALSDLLVSMGIIQDDSLIVDLRLAWSDSIAAPVEITIERAPA